MVSNEYIHILLGTNTIMNSKSLPSYDFQVLEGKLWEYGTEFSWEYRNRLFMIQE